MAKIAVIAQISDPPEGTSTLAGRKAVRRKSRRQLADRAPAERACVAHAFLVHRGTREARARGRVGDHARLGAGRRIMLKEPSRGVLRAVPHDVPRAVLCAMPCVVPCAEPHAMPCRVRS